MIEGFRFQFLRQNSLCLFKTRINKWNQILIIITVSLVMLQSVSLNAEPLQDGFRYGTYGLVAGALAGGASMAFSEDPGSSLTPIAKGASLGLYAGLIVALYINTVGPKESHYDVIPVGLGVGRDSTMGLAFIGRF